MLGISYAINSTVNGFYSFGNSVGNTINATTEKVKEFVTSPISQGVICFGLGTQLYKIYSPLTIRILKVLNFPLDTLHTSDPIKNLSKWNKIFLTPNVCIIAPIVEEVIFRELLQTGLKDSFKSFYTNCGLPNSFINIVSRTTAIFFSSLIFGCYHFTNALFLQCSPMLFLPQVVFTTIMGFMFGIAKEFSGDLYMPCGMHMGNNTYAWLTAYF